MSECARCRDRDRRLLALWQFVEGERCAGATVVRIDLLQGQLGPVLTGSSATRPATRLAATRESA